MITVNILRLFFVKDNVEELALLSLAAGAIGGIGGAKVLALLDDPFRYPVGSLFWQSKTLSHELFSESVERKDNNLFQDNLENFCDILLVDINDTDVNGREDSAFCGNVIISLFGLGRFTILRSFIISHK